MKAKIVEFEGTDGTGKTTSLKYVIEELRKRGKKVLETREVGSPLIPINVKLRELVLNPESDMSGEAMEMVFCAMRFENQKIYNQYGNLYDFIISDRGWFSHLSYTDHNVSKKFTNQLYYNLMAKYTKMPDVVVYFDVDTSVALQRRIKRNEKMDVIEMKGVEYQEKVRESFVDHMGLENGVFRTASLIRLDVENGEVTADASLYSDSTSLHYKINANHSIEDVQKQLQSLVEDLVDKA